MLTGLEADLGGLEMRVVAWNCYQGTGRKVPTLLDRLRPDIAVVPESASRPMIALNSLTAPGVPHAWTGAPPSKGLGIFGLGADRLEVITPHRESGARHGLAVRADITAGQVTVLGIWTLPLAGGPWRTGYMNSFARVLSDCRRVLAAGDVIVAGDLNCSAQSSPEAFPELLDIVRDRYGLRSAYHTFRGLAPGEETSMTLWWRRKESSGYHCDLVLVPEAWRDDDVVVGSYEEWGRNGLVVSSDHAPVMVDLARPTLGDDSGRSRSQHPRLLE